MRKLFAKMAKPFIIKVVIKKLEEDTELRKRIIDGINEKVDIPKIDEKQEEKFLNSIFEAVKEVTIDILKEL